MSAPPSGHPDLMQAHAAWVRRLARTLVRDEARADDVVQEAWVEVIEAPPVRRVLDYRAWFGGVLRNVARESNRSESRRTRREQRSPERDPLPSAADLVERAELQTRVAGAVLDLDEPYRSTLLLRYFEDLSGEEIAEREGVPGSTVRNRLKRGLDLLRARLDREHGGDRRAWSLALVAIAAPRGAGAALVASATTVAKGNVMSLKAALLTVVAVPAVGAAAYFAWDAVSGPSDSTAIASTDRTGGQGVANAPDVDLEETGRTPVDNSSAGATVTAIRGRVTDTNGRPVEGAKVFVGALPSPFDGWQAAVHTPTGRDLEPNREWGEGIRERDLVLGRHFETDADGRYAARLPSAAKVFVCLAASPGIAKDTGECGWHDAPASDVDFTATLRPTSSIAVTVLDQSTGELLPRFSGRLFRDGAGEGARFESDGDTFRRTFELVHGSSALTIELVEPPWAATTEDVLLQPAAHEDVEILVHSGAGFRSQVTDAAGAPLEGAFVYWGDALRMRSGNLFRAYDPEHVPDGVWTDAEGRFDLRGEGEVVTAWHPEHSSLSTAPDASVPLALPPRGSIVGRLTEPDGTPLAGARVVLDREREGPSVTSDAEGRFRFAAVEAGVHGIGAGERLFLGVQVPAGGALEISDTIRHAVTAQVTQGGEPFDGDIGGLGLGLDEVFGVLEFRTENGQWQRENLRPGRYVFMSRGKISLGDFTEPNTAIDVGDADLTIHAPEHSQIFVIPEARNGAAEYWARRMTVEPEDGAAVYSPLPVGRYRVGREGSDVLVEVDVTGPGAEVTLD